MQIAKDTEIKFWAFLLYLC